MASVLQKPSRCRWLVRVNPVIGHKLPANFSRMAGIGRGLDQDEHIRAVFDRRWYEERRGTTFRCDDAAYLDWCKVGARAGLEFAAGHDALLTIVLKAKDELELIENWLTYHAQLVGAHNLVIVDCGSEDPVYLEKLRRNTEGICVLTYQPYYDTLHSVEMNREFYAAISRRAKYVCVLDADEYLVALDGGRLSSASVRDILRDGQTSLFVGTWIHNIGSPAEDEGAIAWDQPIEFGISNASIEWDTVAGKAILASRYILDAQHIGHNLAVKELCDLAERRSFARICVFHVTTLSSRISKKRTLQHLRAKQVVPDGITDENDISAYLSRSGDGRQMTPIERLYIDRYLAGAVAPSGATHRFRSCILGGGPAEDAVTLEGMFADADFDAILRHQRAALDQS